MATSKINRDRTNLKTKKVFLPQNQTINGSFDIRFNVAVSGYYPIGVIGFHLNDRGLADKLFFTSMYVSDNSEVRLMGLSNTSVTLTTNACVYVLYQEI